MLLKQSPRGRRSLVEQRIPWPARMKARVDVCIEHPSSFHRLSGELPDGMDSLRDARRRLTYRRILGGISEISEITNVSSICG